MDETALPILLVDMALREGALRVDDLSRLWPMVRRAAAYLARNGPVTQQDRWETSPGYSPFTLAAEIAALFAAADLAERAGEGSVATYLRETADAWNSNIERWTYVTGSDTARKVGVRGYYVRVASPEQVQAASPEQGFVPIKNRPPDQSSGSPAQVKTGIVSPDALALVRFGLRAADDPHIIDTVKAIDATLKVDTPSGRAWRRYQGDEYGEHADGSPFDGSGIGRAWPLLTGERAHYELAAGRRDAAEHLLHAMEAFAGEGGLMPEQVWDAPDIPEKGLFCGRPSGSAMPLVWAQAEYVKLRRSLQDGRVFDMPPQTVQRYQVKKTGSPHAIWRFNQKCLSMQAGKVLRIETLAPARVHWSSDGWRSVQDSDTRDTGLGVHLCDLPTEHLSSGSRVTFTFYWPQAGRWEGKDFRAMACTAACARVFHRRLTAPTEPARISASGCRRDSAASSGCRSRSGSRGSARRSSPRRPRCRTSTMPRTRCSALPMPGWRAARASRATASSSTNGAVRMPASDRQGCTYA
jgi:glucoamylase